MNINFKFSFEVPEVVPILAYWSTMEWLRNELQNISLRERINTYLSRNDPHKLPLTLVAFDYEFPVGMISLKENDLKSRPDLSPWLASFYVIPEYRKRGIGSSLYERMLNKAMFLEFDVIYLNTYQASSYYRNRDWQFVCDAICAGGHKGEIYRKRLKSA